MCRSCSTVLLILLLAFSAKAGCPTGDLSGDCKVDSEDLKVLAGEWLALAENPADLNADQRVGMPDFALLAETWSTTGLPLVINELSAVNDSAIADPQGEYDDWIEIHNAGPVPIDVGGMYLTDDLDTPAMWRIPDNKPSATTIPANGYLLIWTDNDTTDSGLHANFRLDAAGEEVGLFAADGKTLIDGTVFGNQEADISYGRLPDASDKWRLMAFPTPAAPNIGVYAGFVEELQFSHDSRLCAAPFFVTIATETEGAVIYYTLDGTSPYSEARGVPIGMIYTDPILISAGRTVRAVATKPGYKSTEIVSRRYIFPHSDLQSFSSNLPIAIVDTFGEGVTQSRQTPAFAAFIDTAGGGRARITDSPDYAGSSAINIRGKSSAGFPKKQYHLEMWDEHDNEDSVSILGFPAESDWVLQGPYSDKSLMRNFLSYKWSNDIGRYAPRCRFIEVFLNTDTRGLSMSDYVGVYVFMEKIKQGEDRVDIVQLSPSDDSEPEITGGYMFKKDKFDSGDPDERTFRTSRGQHLIYVEPRGPDITVPQQNWLKGYLDEFEGVLYGGNFKNPVTGYAKYIDPASFVDHHIIVELTKNIDGFRLSTYMYKDRGDRVNMGPVWDYNLSLGNANYLNGWIASGWYYSGLDDGAYPYWGRLFQDPEFRLLYADRWFHFRRDALATDTLVGDIDDAAALIEEAQARNFDRWRILGSYVWPNWYIADTWHEEIEWMKGWLEDRMAWMDGEIGRTLASAPPVFNQHGGHVGEGFRLTMTAPSGAIYYTLDGSDPRKGVIGGDTGEVITLVSRDAPKRVYVPGRPISDAWMGGQAFDDSTWTFSVGGPGGVGYETGSGYEPYISVDVGGSMFEINTTCYVRIPFTFAGFPSDLAVMTLRMQYDDGFVAYLNGDEVARRNFEGEPIYNSAASTTHFDGEAVIFEDIDISDGLGSLRQGENILAIQGLNASKNSSDFLICAELSVSGDAGGGTPGGTEYTGPITLTESTQVKARILDRGAWSAAADAFFAIGPVAQNLRITEIMYHPPDTNSPDDPNTEFIELKNVGTETINLNLVKFTDGIEFTFPSAELAPDGHVLVVRDIDAFTAKYGSGFNVAGEYGGSLNNNGERVELQDAAGLVIHNFRYRDGWYDITDGDGFSLTVKDPAGTDPNRWSDKSTWRPSASIDGSPGSDDTGQIPELGDVVINEILSHSHAEASDWIELHNTTDHTINIGGWFLSDDSDNLTKYEIAEGRNIRAGGYVVFTEHLHFGNWSDPGSNVAFALSENGETLYLQSGRDGVVTGYSEQERFGASETGVAFGRYQKSTGSYNFVAMSVNTPNAANAYPRVGPIVITEIMYHPDNPAEAEYVELLNISDTALTLYDFVTAEPWRFTDDPDNPGIEFLFPSDPPVTLAAGEYVLMVKDLATFGSVFAAPSGTQIFAWGAGRLDNGGEKVQISMPGDVDASGDRHYIRVDRVRYSDGSHHDDFAGGTDPWPTWADGLGMALGRLSPHAYGNDPNNWQAVLPSPGQ
ncbi:MAG: CotH kinase family protein [Phycisphaerales bacterium]|nr:MAG: CotH kinase family protein [Phycisphaerales bacterium]